MDKSLRRSFPIQAAAKKPSDLWSEPKINMYIVITYKYRDDTLYLQVKVTS